jgi:long-chain acyl-CoA synthetase
MLFTSLPDARAATEPDRPAVADGEHSLTNAALLSRVRAASEHLYDLGIGLGDVVAVTLKNQVEFVVLMFAVWRLGATVAPVNPALPEGEIARQVRVTGARLLIANHADSGPDEIPTLGVDSLRREAVDARWSPPRVKSSALAMITFTAGTTGAPKGVMLDHLNLDAAAHMGRQALSIGPTDRCLLVLPLFRINDIVVSILAPLLAGASIVVTDRFDAKTYFDAVERYRPTYFSALPPTIYTALAAFHDGASPDMSSLRFGYCGSAPASAELLAHFEDRYGIPLIEVYGLSEGTGVSTFNPVNGMRREGMVGSALPGQRIRVVNGEGTDARAGVDGEVIIAGPNVMRGYLGRPGETTRAIVDGWLYTGDIGHLDEDGYLTLVGRSEAATIRG